MNRDPDCIFCKIVSGEIPCHKVFEDDKTLAFMDVNPASEGHCLVIPKHHAPNLYEIPDDVMAATAASTWRVARAIDAALLPTGLNLVQANGPGAVQSVLHFHFHVLPRWQGDGDLKLNWGHNPGDHEKLAAVAERIRAAIE